jgi:hypothetical protein
MHRIGFFVLLAFAPLLAASGSSPVKESESEACGKEIQLIDQQVEKLEKQKKQHQDLARQYQEKGDNWRYSSGNAQEAYLNWGKADQERRKAIDIQQQIDLLLQRKKRIIQFYPELWQP